MKGYSLTFGGIFVMIALPLLVQFGFSEGCSNELVTKLEPILSMIPGAIMALIGRYRKGDITLAGFKK